MVLGIVALIPVILLAPFFLVGLGRIAGPEPVAVQIALRELARHRARLCLGTGRHHPRCDDCGCQRHRCPGSNLASIKANIESGPANSSSESQLCTRLVSSL